MQKNVKSCTTEILEINIYFIYASDYVSETVSLLEHQRSQPIELIHHDGPDSSGSLQLTRYTLYGYITVL